MPLAFYACQIQLLEPVEPRVVRAFPFPTQPRNRPRVHAARLGWLLVLVLLLLVGDTDSPRAEADPEGEVISRRILALHTDRSTPRDEPFFNRVSVLAEMPLNHLGYVVEEHCIFDGEPPEAWSRDRAAILTWFDTAEPLPDWVLPWLIRERKRKPVRFIHLGQPPLNVEAPEAHARLNAWLAPFGVTWKDGYVRGLASVKTEYPMGKAARYEADPGRDPTHHGLLSVDDRNTVWVRTRRRIDPNDVRTPVVTGPWGAFALGEWVADIGEGDGTRRWHLDPFLFFEKALGRPDMPAPDPMVHWGRRAFLFHLDGDGFESVSRAMPGVLTGEVFRREIVEKYPIPMTVSIIVSSISKTMTPERDTAPIALARKLLAPEHVEAGSHGVIHPFKWDEKITGSSLDRRFFAYPEPEGFKYTQENEATLGADWLDKYVLADSGKRTSIMLWTGECQPSREAIEAVTKSGRWNINGGTYRWDTRFNSVGYVSPFARRAGTAWQVFAGAANEAEFPGFFTTHPGAFRHVAHTISRSGAERILKPANIYAHLYSAEDPIRLQSLKGLLDRFAYKERTIPIFASTYAKAVVGAFDAVLVRYPDGWGFRNMGGCRTLRFDQPVTIDLDRSEGIAGYWTRGDSTYVHLSRQAGRIRIGEPATRGVYLEDANHLIEVLRLDPQGIAIRSAATFPRQIVLAGLPPESSVRWKFDEQSQAGFTDEAGRLTIRLDAGRAGMIEVDRH